MLKFDYQELKEIVQAAFERVAVGPEDSALMAESLLEANLAGYDSHGIIRLPFYIKSIQNGKIIPANQIKILKETQASAYIDCNLSLGPVSAKKVFQIGIGKARKQGVACLSCVNSTYIARLGGFVEEVAQEGLIGILMANDAGGFASVAPYGGTKAFFSTNPLAAAIPRQDNSPILIDISTSVTALGKLRILANQDKTVPEGYLIKSNGETEIDPKTFFKSPMESALLPLGGLTAGHKGYALGLLVDILAGGLSGMGCSTGDEKLQKSVSGFFALVIDPEHFVSAKLLNQLVEELVENLKASPTADGVSKIMIPGERLAKEKSTRLKEGIEIDPVSWEKIQETLD